MNITEQFVKLKQHPRAELPDFLWLKAGLGPGHGQGWLCKRLEAFSEIQRVVLPSLGGQFLAAEPLLGPEEQNRVLSR